MAERDGLKRRFAQGRIPRGGDFDTLIDMHYNELEQISKEELKRIEQEIIRQQNETNRNLQFQSGELAREQFFNANESERISLFEEAESKRDGSEDARQANEQARESAESERVSNEEERELNEAERISKDGERDSKIETFVEDVNGKLDNKVDTSEIDLYAKKEQEDWITPTLINGWEQHGAYDEVGYYKDDFGVVHLRGSVGQGEAKSTIFTLPSGYRPRRFAFYPVSLSAGSSAIGSLYIDNAGGVFSYQTGTGLALNHISFRAER